MVAQKNIRRIVDERDAILTRIDKSLVPPQLPTEILMQIAGYLRWDHWYDHDAVLVSDIWGILDRGRTTDRSYLSLRQMARAFSVVDGMEDAILRMIPLVLIHSADAADHVRLGRCAEWHATFQRLSSSQKKVIGDTPRLCRYDDEDTISRTSPDEEVHLLLSSEDYANVSTRVFQKRLGYFHVHLSIPHHTTPNLQNFVDSFLDLKLLPHISSLTIAGDGEIKSSSSGFVEHRRSIDTSGFRAGQHIAQSVGCAGLPSHAPTSHCP